MFWVGKDLVLGVGVGKCLVRMGRFLKTITEIGLAFGWSIWILAVENFLDNLGMGRVLLGGLAVEKFLVVWALILMGMKTGLGVECVAYGWDYRSVFVACWGFHFAVSV